MTPYSKFGILMAVSLGLEQKVSDETQHKFLCASSSLHHSVFVFSQARPRQSIGVLVLDQVFAIKHPTAHRYRVLPHSSCRELCGRICVGQVLFNLLTLPY